MRCPGRLPEDDDTLTIRPQPRSAISGIAARMSRIGAITWISHIACHSSSVSAAIDRTWLMPAPLTSTSTVSNRSRHAATARSPASGSVTSSASQETVRASPWHCSAAARSAASPRPTSRTRAPSATSPRAT